MDIRFSLSIREVMICVRILKAYVKWHRADSKEVMAIIGKIFNGVAEAYNDEE